MPRKEDDPKKEDIELLPLHLEKRPDFIRDDIEKINEWINKMPEELRDRIRDRLKEEVAKIRGTSDEG